MTDSDYLCRVEMPAILANLILYLSSIRLSPCYPYGSPPEKVFSVVLDSPTTQVAVATLPAYQTNPRRVLQEESKSRPHTLSHTNSSINMNIDNWNLFWDVNENRKLYYKTTKIGGKQQKSSIVLFHQLSVLISSPLHLSQLELKQSVKTLPSRHLCPTLRMQSENQSWQFLLLENPTRLRLLIYIILWTLKLMPCTRL